MLTLNPPLPWATWQELRSESKLNSEAVLSKMLEAKVRIYFFTCICFVDTIIIKKVDLRWCFFFAHQNIKHLKTYIVYCIFLDLILVNILFCRSLPCVRSGQSSTLSLINWDCSSRLNICFTCWRRGRQTKPFRCFTLKLQSVWSKTALRWQISCFAVTWRPFGFCSRFRHLWARSGPSPWFGCLSLPGWLPHPAFPEAGVSSTPATHPCSSSRI